MVEEKSGGEDEEMTEEEWSRRVAELNALQVEKVIIQLCLFL